MISKEELRILQTGLTFWEHLTQDQQEYLAANTKNASYEKGQTLRCTDCSCIGVLLVTSGTIRVFITSEEGREVTLYRLDAGDVCILSASCVLRSITFDVSVEAETDSRLLQIGSSVFSRLTSENVYVELFSYKLATQRLSEIMWAMQQILFISFDKRLAAFLLDESIKTDSDTIRMTHEQIARHLGSAREVVSRMLKYFSQEGYVTLLRGSITISDKKRLRSVAL